MAEQDLGYWPAVDPRALTTDEWLAFKERVLRESRMRRAQACQGLIQRLFQLYRRAPAALSPTEPDALRAGLGRR